MITHLMFYLQTGHVCDTPGCGSVLVLDGNMKNCRQVCACRDIGELKFAALQGSVVVGVYFSLEFFFPCCSDITMLIECTVWAS